MDKVRLLTIISILEEGRKPEHWGKIVAATNALKQEVED